MFFKFAVPALIALAAVSFFVQDVQGCAPTNNTNLRRKRSVDEDVNVLVLSSRNFDLAKNEENMKTVERMLKEFADREGISFKQLQQVPRTAENVGGKFGVHFSVEGAFDKCARVLQFIQSATNQLEEVVSATVQCGAFDAVHVTKKGDNSTVVDDDEDDSDAEAVAMANAVEESI